MSESFSTVKGLQSLSLSSSLDPGESYLWEDEDDSIRVDIYLAMLKSLLIARFWKVF